MNIKRFQTISKIISIILKFTVIIMLGVVLLGVFFLNDYKLDIVFNSIIEDPIFHISSYHVEHLEYSNIIKNSLQITAVLEIAVLSYVYWRSAQLFKDLSIGEKPFTTRFAQSVKSISLIIIASDLLFPLLLSLIITLQLERGYYLMFDFTSMFLFGLMLYVFSGIFYYGIELQTLADDTI